LLLGDITRLEEQSFELLTGVNSVTRENLVPVVTVLFDVSDFDKWKVNPATGVLLSDETSPESKKRLKSYKYERQKQADRYIQMFDVSDSSARINKNQKAQKVL